MASDWSVFFLLFSSHPGMTFAVNWALHNNYLSILFSSDFEQVHIEESRVCLVLVEHRLENIQRPEVRTPPGAQEKEFFPSRNVVLTRCRCAQAPCVYARIRIITYAH